MKTASQPDCSPPTRFVIGHCPLQTPVKSAKTCKNMGHMNHKINETSLYYQQKVWSQTSHFLCLKYFTNQQKSVETLVIQIAQMTKSMEA